MVNLKKEKKISSLTNQYAQLLIMKNEEVEVAAKNGFKLKIYNLKAIDATNDPRSLRPLLRRLVKALPPKYPAPTENYIKHN